jgi:hypothetical protein
VLHDLPIPGSKANIDHVVVTPSGITVIDSKNYSGRVSVGNGMLRHGRFPMSRQLDTLLWETDQVRIIVARRLPRWQVNYRSILCIHGAQFDEEFASVGQVDVAAPSALVSTLTRGPALLTSAHIVALGTILRSDSAAGSPQPATQAPQTPSPMGATLRTRSDSGPTHSRPRDRPVTTRAVPARQRAPNTFGHEKRVLVVIVLLILLALVGGRVATAGGHVLTTLLIQVPRQVPYVQTLTPTIAAAVVPPELSFACPGSGKGWSLSLRWAPAHIPSGPWEATTAPNTAGPWTIRYVGSGQPPLPILTGLAPGTGLLVRSGGVVDMVTGQSLTQVEARTPSSKC